MFIKERIVDVMADQREARGLTSQREAPVPIKVAKKGRRIIEAKEEPRIELEGEEKGESTIERAYPGDANRSGGRQGARERQQGDQGANHRVPQHLSREVPSSEDRAG